MHIQYCLTYSSLEYPQTTSIRWTSLMESNCFSHCKQQESPVEDIPHDLTNHPTTCNVNINSFFKRSWKGLHRGCLSRVSLWQIQTLYMLSEFIINAYLIFISSSWETDHIWLPFIRLLISCSLLHPNITDVHLLAVHSI